MTRLMLRLACLLALAGIPASAASASQQAGPAGSSINAAHASAATASRDDGAVDPHIAPSAPIALAPVQQESATRAAPHSPDLMLAASNLPAPGQIADPVHADGLHARWSVEIRGYRATGPPTSRVIVPIPTPSARLA